MLWRWVSVRWWWSEGGGGGCDEAGGGRGGFVVMWGGGSGTGGDEGRGSVRAVDDGAAGAAPVHLDVHFSVY